MNWRSISVAVTMGLASVNVVVGNDWPQWRGPDRNGISKESGWMDTWPQEGPPVAWKANVGQGFSSFVVSGGRAVVVGHGEVVDTVFLLRCVHGKRNLEAFLPVGTGR